MCVFIESQEMSVGLKVIELQRAGDDVDTNVGADVGSAWTAAERSGSKGRGR